MDFNQRILPYYMTYQVPYGNAVDNTAMRDLEYLQQMYPLRIRRYQVRIAQILDRLDYEGSMIYDEYPDRESLSRLSEGVLAVLEREEAAELQRVQLEAASLPETDTLLTVELVQVLLCNEIYKRRHGGKRGGILF